MIDIDTKHINREVAKKCSKKFGSHKVLYSKGQHKTPKTAEREYLRIINDYMKILKEEIQNSLPELKKAYKENRDVDVKIRNDSMTDFHLSINSIFSKMQNNVIKKVNGFGFIEKLERLATINRKLTVKQWKRTVKSTIGLDIREDYYLGDFYAKELEKWIVENVDLIKTIPEETLLKMKDIVSNGYEKGATTTQIARDIQIAYGVSKRRAAFIARDQTAKLNRQIQKAQQQDAGINEYIWDTSGDERVRESHKALNGKKFSWENPPLNDDGRNCHPGEDYGCRCIARPVFDIETINLPLEERVMSKGGL